jgi:alanine racemase
MPNAVNIARSRAWVEVDLAALRSNFETVRRAAGSRAAVIPMVKANAYGTGSERVVGALEPLAPWGYGVATANEGADVRGMGVTRPILVIGPLPPDSTTLAAEHGLTPGISELDALDRWNLAAQATGKRLDFHVEIDTGMGRAGFDWRETAEWGRQVRDRCTANLRWTGVYSHFHGADAPDAAVSAAQWERFRDALGQLPVSREDLLVHISNSAAALRWPEYAADAVRPGIFLYGGQPAAPGAVAGMSAPAPVVALRARVVLIREVPPGSTVGYGATHVARSWERWGTLSIGYGDGLPRAIGNRGAALVRGSRVPIIGRISMDMTVVDLTSVPESVVGDIATLIGTDAGATITLDEVAVQAGTIGYEILTGLTARLPRVEN